MARDIGPKIGIDGEREYRREIQQIIQQGKTLAAEMKAVSASFSRTTSQEEKTEKESKALSAVIENQRAYVAKLRERLEELTQTEDENSTAVLKQREALAKAETALGKLERQADNTEDEVDDLSDAEEENASAAKKAEGGNKGFGDTLKALVASNAISAIVSGLKELAGELVGFVKDAVLGYGELEQALGGSEAVFGDYAQTIQDTAKSAWRTMGQSEAEYLASANTIGALLQGSGFDAQTATETTIAVMQRAADMASVMGTDLATAMDAVTGAARGTYTMMDKLGVNMDVATLQAYALKQGETAVWSELSNTSKAEYAMAYFLEKTQQYMGNFAAEAENTVSGSIEMAKTAAKNWITNLGNSEADIAELTANMMDSFRVAAENVLPIVQNVVQNLVLTAKDAWPTVKAALGELLGSLDTALSDWGASVSAKLDAKIAEFTAGIGQMWEGFVGSLADFAAGIDAALADIGMAVSTAIDGLISSALTWGSDMITNFLNGIKAKWTDLTDTLNSWGATVRDFIGFSEPKKGELSKFHTFAPDMMQLFSQGVLDNRWRIEDALTSAFDISPIIESSAQGAVTNFGGVTLNVYTEGAVDGEELYQTFVHRLQLDTMDRGALFA